MAVNTLQHTAKSVVAEYMRVEWHTVGHICRRVYEELEHKSTSRFNGLVNLGIDETSYKKVHKYMTIAINHDTAAKGIYIVLRQHGWRKIMPRSRHPKKADMDTMPPPEIYIILNSKAMMDATAKFRTPPQCPAPKMEVMADSRYISVGILNVVNYSAYDYADPAAYEACVNQYGARPPATIETTHSIVKMCAGEIPTLFISPITNRYRHFAEDVQGEQNFVAGYNAGVTVAALLREVEIP